MMLNRRELLFAAIVGVQAVVLSACTEQTTTTTRTLDKHNGTVYDHSELAWYMQQRYGVDEDDCQFYAFEAFGQACLLARGTNDSGNHYILRAFGEGVSNWYRQGSWIVEAMNITATEQTYNDKSIEYAEFVVGNTILHMFVADNKSGKIERMFLLRGTDDYFKKEGELFIWEYDRNGRPKGLFHSSGLFAEAFYGVDVRGEFTKNYGDYDIFSYDSEGRLDRVSFSSAKLSDNMISEIQGSTGVGIGSLVFTYDIDGNRKTVTQDVSGRHEVVEFSHDSDGKVVQVTISESDLFDANAESYRAKVTVTYRTDGSTEYSEPIVE